MSIEVYPDKGGEWRWRKRSANGDVVADSGEGYSARAGAISAARKEAGAQTYNLTDTETDEVVDQHTTPAKEQVVLLREDGSMVGELNPAPSESEGPAQHVDLEPVESSEEA